MTFNELPKGYQELYLKNCGVRATIPENLMGGFTFKESPEGHNFWLDVYNAKTIEQLPPLPVSKTQTTVDDMVKLLDEFGRNTGTTVSIRFDSNGTGHVKVIDMVRVYTHIFDFKDTTELIEYLKNGFIKGETK